MEGDPFSAKNQTI